MANKLRKILLRTAGLLSIVGYQIYQNKFVKNRVLELFYEDLPEELDHYRIAHISDLHGAVFGHDNQKLEQMIMGLEPDILCITGDMVHKYSDSGDAFINLAAALDENLIKLFVTGNHEMVQKRGGHFEQLNRSVLYRKLENYNVRILNGTTYTPPGLPITFTGIDDNYEHYEGLGFREADFNPGDYLPMPSLDTLNVALIHRPNYFRSIADYGYQLMLSGHTHGGVMRIGKGGLLSPEMKFFPEFDKGLFRRGNSYLHVTSGLGLAKPIPRVDNRPEIVLLILRKGTPDLKKVKEVKEVGM